MISLSTLKNTHTLRKKVQRVGRGVGSGRGKTSCRGYNGDKSRSGYKCRFGNEGGQMALYRKLPCRGFSNHRFQKGAVYINLDQLEALYENGEVVNLVTLHEKGYRPKSAPKALRILGEGTLNKKLSIEAHHFSKSAKDKLSKQTISFKEI